MSKGSSKVLAGEKWINQKHPVEAQVRELLHELENSTYRTMSLDELLDAWLDSWMVMHGWLCPWIGRAGQVGHKKIGVSREKKNEMKMDGRTDWQTDPQTEADRWRDKHMDANKQQGMPKQKTVSVELESPKKHWRELYNNV